MNEQKVLQLAKKVEEAKRHFDLCYDRHIARDRARKEARDQEEEAGRLLLQAQEALMMELMSQQEGKADAAE